MTEAADALTDAGRMVQRERWRLKIATGYDVNAVRIPKRFKEVVTWKGPVDVAYMDALKQRYARAILDMAAAGGGEN
jgi:aldehyde:ferredoxin oxidoreductase